MSASRMHLTNASTDLRGGLCPISTFGHPEVYIRAPLRSYFSTRLSRHHCTLMLNWCKSLSPHAVGNERVRSGNERGVSPAGLEGKKRSLDTSTMDRMTNLSHCAAELHCSLRHNPLRASASDGPGLVRLRGLLGMPTSHLRRGIHTAQQGPKVDNDGNLRTAGSPKSRKAHGDGGVVVEPEGSKDASLPAFGDSPFITAEGERNLRFKKLNPNKLIHYISHRDTLVMAYELTRSNPGGLTRGSLDETLDGISSK